MGVAAPPVGRGREASPWPGTLSGEHPPRYGRVLAAWVSSTRRIRAGAWRWRPWLLGAVAGLGLAACDSRGDTPPGPGPAAFAGSAASLEELGRQVWQAIVAGDTASLAALRLTRSEYIDSVWPELPAARPEINFPTELAWLNLSSRDAAALERVLPRYAGSARRYAWTTCDSIVAYASYRMHSGCRVTVAGDTGATQPLRLELFRHAVERDGGWKVVRYYDPVD